MCQKQPFKQKYGQYYFYQNSEEYLAGRNTVAIYKLYYLRIENSDIKFHMADFTFP